MRRVLFAAVVATLFLAFNNHDACAQPAVDKVELGAQFSLIRFRGLQAFDPNRILVPRRFDKTNAGFGGRVTFNIAYMFAVEGEANFFPDDNEDEGGQKTQVLAGVRAGARGERIGIFAKARPGFVRFSRLLDCPNADLRRCGLQPRTEFALDLGGVFEFYPSRRAIVRFDLGDTLIFHRDRVFINLFPLPGGGFEEARTHFEGNTTHNLQFSVGIGIRF